jgi:hypothetical protein
LKTNHLATLASPRPTLGSVGAEGESERVGSALGDPVRVVLLLALLRLLHLAGVQVAALQTLESILAV